MEETLLDLIAELAEDDSVREDLDRELFASGLIDSLAFVELIYGIEDSLGVVIAPSEVAREDLDTPRKIIEQVKARLA